MGGGNLWADLGKAVAVIVKNKMQSQLEFIVNR